jgi:hypothetical protein
MKREITNPGKEKILNLLTGIKNSKKDSPTMGGPGSGRQPGGGLSQESKAKLVSEVKSTNSLEKLHSIAGDVGLTDFHNMNKEMLRTKLISFIK